MHRGAKRRHNAKRKFLHRLEWVAGHLQQTFDDRQKQYPTAALQRFQGLLNDAEPLIGVRAPYTRPTVRRTQHLARSLRGRLWRRLLLLVALTPPLALLLSGPPRWAGLGGLAALALAWTLRHRRRLRRHDDLAVASRFSVPADLG